MDDVDPRDADEDFDEEDLLATWAAVDRHSAKFLRTTLEDVLAEPSPEDDLDRAAQQVREGVDSGSPMFDYVRAACGWTDAPALAPRALWLSAVASTISPIEDPGTDPEEQSAVTALEHVDWFALVQGLVRRGVGTELDAETVITDLDTTGEDASIIRLAVTVLTPLWRTLGVLDDEDQLTALGRWGLPRALHTAWVGEDPDDYQDPRGPELSEEDAQVVLGLLAERPMDLEELRVVAAKHGIFADEQVLQRSLVWRDDVFWCSDGIWVHLPTLLAGTVLSRRLTAAEIELGILDGSLDLDLWSIVMEGRPLVAGGTVTARFRVDEKPLPGGTSVGLVGPEGWLEGFDTGDLLGMRYLDGGFALEKVDEPPAVDDRVQVIIDAAWRAARLDAEHGDPERPGASGAEVVLLALRERPDLFEQPVPPLSEIVASTELEVVEGYIGLPGTVWEPEPAYLTESERPAYRRWRAVAGAFLSSGRIPEGEVLRELAVEAMAVVDYLAPEVSDRPELDPLLEAWQDAAPARLVGVPLFLRSRAAEGRGDLASWRSLLEMAVEKDPNLPGAAEDLAFLRNVAGDVRAAVRLYEAAGLDDDWPELRVLRPLLAVPSADVGRNKPCPCGSGKKYKVCHGRTARHPLEDRSLALWGKLFAFAQRSRQRAHLLEWAHLFSGEGLMDEATVRLAMEDSFVNDVAIIEGGLADDFLELLGELLPEDERKLAIGWAGTPLRLLEVQQVVPMRGVTVRDLVDGETFEIRDRRITTQARVKDLMLGRPLDDGAGVKRFYSDPVSIPRMQRSPVLRLLRDGAPVEDLIALLYGRAMPTLQNSEGHELLTCTSRHRLSAPDEMWAQLAEGWEVDGDRIVVHGPAGAGGGRTVRGSFTRSAHEVVTETNSIERLRELQGLLMKADPAAVLVSESSHPLTDMPGPGGPRTMEEPPELAPDLVAQIVRAQEDDWLANPVPALDGRTPREAAADPALRPELAALLDDFEWTSRRIPNALTMDVARLRSELGLA